MSLLRDHSWKKEHSEIKHQIFEKYFIQWVRILRKFRKIYYFDCCAGPGKFEDGTLGSPLLAMHTINEVQNKLKLPETAECTFYEIDKHDFRNLSELVENENKKYLNIRCLCEQKDFTVTLPGKLEEVRNSRLPAFFFIDPCGFSIPFSLVKDIMSIPRTEILLTFMCEFICRCSTTQFHEKRLTELFGTEDWKKISHLPEAEKGVKLLGLYIKKLQEVAGVKYPWAFKMSRPDERRTIYYLIYATNNFLGLDIMKGIMYNMGKTLPFAYLGPDEIPKTQKSLYEYLPTEEGRYITPLKNFLLDHFSGKTKTFYEIREELWYLPPIEKHYRTAIKELIKEEKIKVKNVGPKGGISDNVEISFK